MLEFKMCPRTGILEVKQTLLSATKSIPAYWYYDTRNWLKSTHGKQGDIPDRIMYEDDIQWVKRNYLPKVQGQPA